MNHLRHAVDTAHQSLDVGALSDPAGEELIRISEEVGRGATNLAIFFCKLEI